jgi:hypothetical protein
VPAPAGANVVIHLGPERRTFAKSMLNLINIIVNSDAKKYAAGKPFLPIFPNDDPAIEAALLVIADRLTAVINPG